MALTEAQEKLLLDNVEANKASIAALVAENAGFKTQLAEKDTKIVELQKGQTMTAEDLAMKDLRSKFPTVPESTLKALPVASREAEAKVLHEALSKVAPATDPLKAWSTVGSVMPSLDAETEAEKIERSKAKAEAMKAGNPQGVLAAKSNDITRFVLSSVLGR